MIHEDLLIQRNRIKKEKKKDRSVISEGTGTCNERWNWQTNDGWQQDSHHKNEKKRKNKEKHYDAGKRKRKRKFDEDVFDGSELFDAKRRGKNKHEKIH
jgi:hypothetical protein